MPPSTASLSRPTSLLIGQVAAATGIPVKTIRFYADLGLIPTLARTEGGFRVFAPEVVPRLGFIRRAQSLGMSLEEIGQILTIRDQGSPPCDAIHQMLEEKVREIEHRIAELRLLQAHLKQLLQDWRDPETLGEGQICPNLDP